MGRRSDIRMLVEVSAEQQLALDWVLLTNYLALFGLTDRVEAMKVWCGEINQEWARWMVARGECPNGRAAIEL